MTTIQKRVSDHTGKEIVEHFHISIERPGYMIEHPTNNYTNRIEADLLETEIQPFMAKLVYHRMDLKSLILPDRE